MKLPSWLKRDTLKLPPWAKVKKSARVDSGAISICIEGDTDGYVREWFALLGVEPGAADQYWLEVAYQCAKMDLQSAITNTVHDPRTSGCSVEFIFTQSERWAQNKYPAGRGIHAATQGREARDHYRRIRGLLPL